MDGRDVVCIRGEHLSNLYDYRTDSAYRLYWDESRGYNTAFAKKHDEIVAGIVGVPQLKVRVVQGMDDLCNCGCCPRKGDHCESPQLLEKDASVAGTYDLSLGEEYEVGVILDRMLKKGRWQPMPLDTVRLKSGEVMGVKRAECPAGVYAELLTDFLEHKRDTTFRDMKQRLRGDYARDSLDRFFLGEIDGEIVSQMGYMLPRDTMDVGVFGHVYTARKHRGKGAASILMQYCMDDFNAGEGKALFCGVGQEHAQRLYARHGFVPLFTERAPLGPQGYIRPELARDFADLQRMFFVPGRATHVRPAHMGDRPKVDKILLQSDGGRAEMNSRQRVALAGMHSDFVSMFQATEDGRGSLFVLETDERHVVGYSFAFSTGSPAERDTKFLDFLVHPSYRDQEIRLIEDTLNRTEARSVRCLVPACDERRLAAATEAGMKRECVLSGYLAVKGRPVDLMVLVSH